MRLEGNPLDLNSLPEEHGKQPLEESSMTTAASADITRFKKKKSAVKDDSAKVYECRFCSLKFCKSQALGGHMNRHRQERETETLNRARQLVFSNDGAIGLRDPSAGGSQIPPGGFQHRGGSIGEPCLQFQPVYPGLPNPPPMSQYLHPSSSSSSSRSHPHPPAYQPPHPHYYIGHVVSGSSQRQPPHHGYSPDPSFTCYGAPVSHSFPVEEGRAPTARGNHHKFNC